MNIYIEEKNIINDKKATLSKKIKFRISTFNIRVKE